MDIYLINDLIQKLRAFALTSKVAFEILGENVIYAYM